MRCPECQKGDIPHKLRQDRLPPSPAIPPQFVARYWDEHDRLHIHDPGVYRIIYSCSNGHHYKSESLAKCPVKGCDWNDQEQVKEGQKELGA
jgi:hypothetical protein